MVEWLIFCIFLISNDELSTLQQVHLLMRDMQPTCLYTVGKILQLYSQSHQNDNVTVEIYNHPEGCLKRIADTFAESWTAGM